MIKCKVHYLIAGGSTRTLDFYMSFHIFHSIKGKSSTTSLRLMGSRCEMFLTLALNGREWLISRTSRFTQVE
jgi:hypothetical protein